MVIFDIAGGFALLFMLTQVIIPILRGVQTFPLFRMSETARRIKKARHDLEEASEEVLLGRIEKEARKRKAEAEALKKEMDATAKEAAKDK